MAHMSDTLEHLSGIGPATAAALREAGYDDVASIAAAKLEDLVAVKGFGETRAAAVRSEAQQQIAPDAPPEAEEPKPAKKAKKSKKGKKAKASKQDAVKKQIAKLEQHAKDLSKQAKQMLTKAEGTKSKKKRKRTRMASTGATASRRRKAGRWWA